MTSKFTRSARFRRQFGIALASALAVVAASPRASSAQEGGFRFDSRIPSEYTYACDLDRSELAVRVIARNEEVYPDRVARTANGWLIHDRFERQVVELDEDLRRVRDWGRRGRGPMEYESPVGLGRIDSAHVAVVDARPPSLIVLGPRGNEYRIADFDPEHAVIIGGRIIVASSEATIHEMTVHGQVRMLNARSDFGLPESRGSKAAAANPRLRPGYVGFTGPSAVWVLGPNPRQVVQRCVPEDMEDMLVDGAPMIDLGHPLGEHPMNIFTMQDFLPLGADGFLTVGGLVVRGRRLRSIERYDSKGVLVRAWQLTGYPEVKAAFDEHNIGRMLIWEEDSIDGILLVEAEGMDGLGA